MEKKFAVIDGITQCPDIHSGPIGNMLKNSITLPLVYFPIIPISEEFRLNLINNNVITSDQAYLQDIILAISTGILTGSSTNRSPGKIGYDRLTGNCILRVYVSQNQHNDDMKLYYKCLCLVLVHSESKTRIL